ncbi:hypothetical protein QJS04_geneDACA005151 [Acorus gramineus]|uniref:Zona pellucida glycoprotein 3 n=1 Tax=Acorus gramineus TaxID=55184 RepID=A0AAV9AV26_ACOGR|nr:hypothetical protein QJS04_geneDACA005151 [Acorus gramineus]
MQTACTMPTVNQWICESEKTNPTQIGVTLYLMITSSDPKPSEEKPLSTLCPHCNATKKNAPDSPKYFQ